MSLTVSLLCFVLHASPDRSGLDWFREGVAARENAAQARESFRLAVQAFGERGAYPLSPQLALARSRSHFLSGDTPHAIASLHEGLALAPFNTDLQQDLAAIRETIRYPDPSEDRARVRPMPTDRLRHRVSPGDAFLAASVFGCVFVMGLVKRLTSRPPWSLVLITIGGVGFFATAFLAWQISHNDERPIVVLTAETILRKGNASSYPARIAEILPRGTELHEIGRRGGWIQVEVAGGARGWVEESKSLTTRPASGASPS